MPDILGTGTEYIWKEVEKVSNIASEDTVETLKYNLTNMTEDEHCIITGRKIDWTPLYGNLEEGEYEFIFKANNLFSIKIKFMINTDGQINTDKPEIF